MKDHWVLKSIREVLDTVPFKVEVLEYFDPISKKEVKPPYHRLKSPDWINVFMLTENSEFILVEQKRAGILDFTLESPGGVVDPGEDPETAALRELEEETGYKTRQLISLGATHPNPAISNNKLHMFLALNCYLPSSREHFPDETESIKLHIKPVAELSEFLDNGGINNALSLLTAYKAEKYLNAIK